MKWRSVPETTNQLCTNFNTIVDGSHPPSPGQVVLEPLQNIEPARKRPIPSSWVLFLKELSFGPGTWAILKGSMLRPVLHSVHILDILVICILFLYRAHTFLILLTQSFLSLQLHLARFHITDASFCQEEQYMSPPLSETPTSWGVPTLPYFWIFSMNIIILPNAFLNP